MTELGNGLCAAKRDEEALSVKEADLSMEKRLGASEDDILATESNLATTYKQLGREFLPLRQEVYSGFVKIYGEHHKETVLEAFNYANDLFDLRRFKEARSLLRKTIPIARRILGDSNELTLKVRKIYAIVLCMTTDGSCATLSDVREAVTTLEDAERISRRVLGSAHPLTTAIERDLRNVRAMLRARKTPGSA